MPRVRTTVQPIRFDDLDHRRFEDLARELARRMEVDWIRLEPVGRLGSDHGRDIRGIERVPAKGRRMETEREWRFQVKRRQQVGPADLRQIVQEAVPDPTAVPHAVVAVVAAGVSSDGFDAFHDEARKLGIPSHEVWDRATLNDLLGLPQNADLLARYFGGGPAIDGTVQIPLGLYLSPGRDVELVGREHEADLVLAHEGDLILVGVPGSGKTRLVLEARDVRFLNHVATTDDIADSIRRHQPAQVAVDDAGLDIERVKTLLELRRADYTFSIVATVWSDDIDEIRRWLPDALVVEIDLLERKPMHEILQALGIRNYYLRAEILDQAEGRPGWAVALANLAARGQGADVFTGEGLINQVEAYLRRVGSSSAQAIGLLSIMAALGRVDLDEMGSIDDYLKIDRLERQRLVLDAASAGLLAPDRGGLRVAPEPLRSALVARSFYGETAPWPMAELLEQWPSHRQDVLGAILNAAAMGSSRARAHFDELVGDLSELRPDLLERYAALDPSATERALTTVSSAEGSVRDPVVTAAARRFVSPAAVREMLEAAVGDDRPEHPHPDHPVRVLGEIGSRIDPHGQTSFAARAPLLKIASDWFDEDPNAGRSVVWSKLVVHLLDPVIEGHYQDLGSPMTIQMQAGFESPANLTAIIEDMWPTIEARLSLLDAPALVHLVALGDAWIRLARGYAGAFGSTPTEEAMRIAEPFSVHVMNAIATASAGKPAAQTLLRETSRMFGLRIAQNIDPEFRFLTWQVWRLPRRGQSGLVASTVGKFASCWAAEDPDELMRRIGEHESEANKRGRDLAPMIHLTMEALAGQVADLDLLIDAGVRHGLTYQLRALLQESLGRSPEPPGWLAVALTGTNLRREALVAALSPGVPEPAARLGIDALTHDDLLLVEGAIFERIRSGADWVARALLNHPVASIRGVASICFAVDEAEHGLALPKEWQVEWAEAFVSAPVESARGGDNYQLAMILCRLAKSDPDLVEKWLSLRLDEDAWGILHRLSDRADPCLRALPNAHRERIVRGARTEDRAAVLALFLDDDPTWIAPLIDDGSVDPSEVLQTLRFIDDPDETRARQVVALGRALVERGVSPDEIAATLASGGWSGNESDRYERVRAAFEAVEVGSDSEGGAIRAAGMKMFAEARDKARAEEHRERVSGRF